MTQPTSVHATEVSPQDKSHIHTGLPKLAWVCAPSCSESCRICAGLYLALPTRGVREVHSTVRAAAVRPTSVHATEVSPQDKSHIHTWLPKLAWVCSPSCSERCRICAGLYLTLPTRGVREVHSTVRAAAVRPNGRTAWDNADDSLLVSSLFLLQRTKYVLWSWVRRERRNDRGGPRFFK